MKWLKKKTKEKVTVDPPKKEKMKLVRSGNGARLCYPSGDFCGTEKLQWENRENPSEIRKPQQKVKNFSKLTGFWAAGRYYRSIWDLEAEGSGYWYRDIYGRTVLNLSERFPCFDFYDQMYENRYTRWYFLCEKGKLTRIYYKDETLTVQVTEDVEDLECSCWRDFQRLGYHV